MTTFRFAHISDLHFGTKVDWLNPLDGTTSIRQRASRAYSYLVTSKGIRSVADLFYPSGYNPHVAQTLMHSLWERLPALDAVIATGDLATTGEKEDLRIAAEFFEGKSPVWWHGQTGAIPKLLGEDVVVVTVPGNHDRYDGPLKQPISKQYEQVVGLYWDFDQEVSDSYFLPTAETGRVRYTAFDKDSIRLTVVCADFSLDAANAAESDDGWGHLGQGRVVQEVLSELVDTTLQIKAESDGERESIDSVILWAIHFPPKSPLSNNDLALLGDEALIDAAAACDVRLILCGHTHETRAYTANSSSGASVPIICSGPSCGISDHGQYAYSIIQVHIASGDVAIEPLYYLWEDHKFRPQADFPE